jgi:hypothetical protein
VALVRIDVSEERVASSIKAKGISELETSTFFLRALQLLVTANVVRNSLFLFTLLVEAASSSETSDLTIATRHHIAEAGIPQTPWSLVRKRTIPIEQQPLLCEGSANFCG